MLAVSEKVPLLGSYSSADDVPPPAMSTSSSRSKVAV
jgi:hypothetical protein